MKAAIVNPYLDTLGGGERYSFAVANALVKLGYEVDFEWGTNTIFPKKFWKPGEGKEGETPINIEPKKFESRFGIKLNSVNFVEDVNRGDNYEVCFWVSDGSIPTLKARKNFLHFQVPFHGVNGKSLLNRMKMIRISRVICNSNFTKKIIDEEYGVKSVVIYPPVDVEKIKAKREKQNVILYVGRFSELKQAKRQDVLIDAFKKFYRLGYRNWKLVLAGGVEVGADKYIEKLKKKVKDYPIEIVGSPDFNKIRELFGHAKIYWSASGYGVNEENTPEAVEHFGITVVEAMSGGAIPIIYNAGGHREIIDDSVNGFLWRDIDEMVQKTIKVIEDERLMKLYMKRDQKNSKRFGYEKFEDNIAQLIK
jgi:glycosyltransferase involved in cell wall biosynthesis